MPHPISCSSCGATDVAQLSGTEVRCRYCGVVLSRRPLAPLNPFARTGAAGSRSKTYAAGGLLLITALSFCASWLDSPGWFRSDFAITLWSAVIPVLTLAWAAHLHPERRSWPVFALAVCCNALPFLAVVMLKHAARLSSDDLWGITGLFAGCSATGFGIGAVINNFRK